VLATHNQFSSIEESEQAIAAPDWAAVLHVLEIDNGAAMNPYKVHRAQASLKLLQRGANPVAQSTGMHFNVVGRGMYELDLRGCQ